jgi:1-acyl-sn-glycerol-3-phosphate acyltransferase
LFYWFLKTIVIGPIIKLLFRPWVEGEENIPPEGAAIFASNHLSFSDSIFLPLVVSRRVTFLAKSDYFTGRGLKGRLTAAFFKGVGQLPVDRSGGKASNAALSSGLKVLRRGDRSASIRRAPVRPTAASTADAPGSPGWPSRARSPSSRSP